MDSHESDNKNISVYDSTDPEAGSFQEWVGSVDRVTNVKIQIDRDPNHTRDPNSAPATFEFLVRATHESNAGFMRQALGDENQVDFAHFFVIRGERSIMELVPVIEQIADGHNLMTHPYELDINTPLVETMKAMREGEELCGLALGVIDELDEIFLVGIVVDEAIEKLAPALDAVVEAWA